MSRYAASWVYKGFGRIERDVMEGAAFEMVTLVETSEPFVIPSSGVILHVMLSPWVCGA